MATVKPANKPPFREAPPLPPGMAGPRVAPELGGTDFHLVANGRSGTVSAFSARGLLLWRAPILLRGQGAAGGWSHQGGDTPPGLYRLTAVFDDKSGAGEPVADTPFHRRFGWASVDLEGVEGQEGPSSAPYRDGLMIHGGGSSLGWPGAWAPRQPLTPTLGCPRMHNQDVRGKVLPLARRGQGWLSVYQPTR